MESQIFFFFFFNNSSPVIQEGICFGVSIGQQILPFPASYPILHLHKLDSITKSISLSVVKIGPLFQKVLHRNLSCLRSTMWVCFFFNSSPELTGLMFSPGMVPAVRPLPGCGFSHLLALVGHWSAVAGVTRQGERGTGSTPVRLPRDRLQGAR